MIALDLRAAVLALIAPCVSGSELEGVFGAESDFAHPRWSMAKGSAWQEENARALVDALPTRGVPVRTGELPPELCA